MDSPRPTPAPDSWPMLPSEPPLVEPASIDYVPVHAQGDADAAEPVHGAAPPARRSPLLLAGLLGALLAGVIALLVLVAAGDGDGDTVVREVTIGEVDPNLGLDGDGLDVQAVLNRIGRSVVTIETDQESFGGIFEGAGSGVIVTEDGAILTNAHVIRNASRIEVRLFDGEVFEAELVGSFPDDDIALIQAIGIEGLAPAPLGATTELLVGDEVVAIGNALGLGGTPSVTRGIVSGLDRDLETDLVQLRNLIQTDAAINPGNSGGPLVNARGEVVGINTAIIEGAQNVGFAISIDTVGPLLDQLLDGDADIVADTAFLGVNHRSVAELTPDLREEFGVTAGSGALVIEILPASAASASDLLAGDVIVSVDGVNVAASEDLARYVRDQQPGDVISLTWTRDGVEQSASVTLCGRQGC